MKKLTLDEDILFMAFRYALGRMTYVTHTVSETLIEKWDELSPRIQNLVVREIKEAIELGRAGMDMDVKSWEKVLELEKPSNKVK